MGIKGSIADLSSIIVCFAVAKAPIPVTASKRHSTYYPVLGIIGNPRLKSVSCCIVAWKLEMTALLPW